MAEVNIRVGKSAVEENNVFSEDDFQPAIAECDALKDLDALQLHTSPGQAGAGTGTGSATATVTEFDSERLRCPTCGKLYKRRVFLLKHVSDCQKGKAKGQRGRLSQALFTALVQLYLFIV